MSRDRISDVGVIDKAALLMNVLAESAHPVPLTHVATLSGIHRATAHRLLKSLQVHGFVQIDDQLRWSLGSRLVALGQRAAVDLPLHLVSQDAMRVLRDATTESVQLYVREGDRRVCVASLESPHELRTIVDVGESLPLDRGSAGKVLSGGLAVAGWVESVGERQAGVASVSAPIVDRTGRIRAAISVSGPIERTTREPGQRYGDEVLVAAAAIERRAGWRDSGDAPES